MSFVVQALSTPSAQKSATESLFKTLQLRVNLNNATNKAAKDAAAKALLNIPPSSVATTQNQQKVSDRFYQRDLAMINLQQMLDYKNAQYVIEWLEKTNQVEGFNTFFPKFKDEYKGAQITSYFLFQTLWDKFVQRIEKEAGYNAIYKTPAGNPAEAFEELVPEPEDLFSEGMTPEEAYKYYEAKRTELIAIANKDIDEAKEGEERNKITASYKSAIDRLDDKINSTGKLIEEEERKINEGYYMKGFAKGSMYNKMSKKEQERMNRELKELESNLEAQRKRKKEEFEQKGNLGMKSYYQSLMRGKPSFAKYGYNLPGQFKYTPETEEEAVSKLEDMAESKLFGGEEVPFTEEELANLKAYWLEQRDLLGNDELAEIASKFGIPQANIRSREELQNIIEELLFTKKEIPKINLSPKTKKPSFDNSKLEFSGLAGMMVYNGRLGRVGNNLGEPSEEEGKYIQRFIDMGNTLTKDELVDIATHIFAEPPNQWNLYDEQGLREAISAGITNREFLSNAKFHSLRGNALAYGKIGYEAKTKPLDKVIEEYEEITEGQNPNSFSINEKLAIEGLAKRILSDATVAPAIDTSDVVPALTGYKGKTIEPLLKEVDNKIRIIKLRQAGSSSPSASKKITKPEESKSASPKTSPKASPKGSVATAEEINKIITDLMNNKVPKPGVVKKIADITGKSTEIINRTLEDPNGLSDLAQDLQEVVDKMKQLEGSESKETESSGSAIQNFINNFDYDAESVENKYFLREALVDQFAAKKINLNSADVDRLMKTKEGRQELMNYNVKPFSVPGTAINSMLKAGEIGWVDVYDKYASYIRHFTVPDANELLASLTATFNETSDNDHFKNNPQALSLQKLRLITRKVSDGENLSKGDISNILELKADDVRNQLEDKGMYKWKKKK